MLDISKAYSNSFTHSSMLPSMLPFTHSRMRAISKTYSDSFTHSLMLVISIA